MLKNRFWSCSIRAEKNCQIDRRNIFTVLLGAYEYQLGLTETREKPRKNLTNFDFEIYLAL